MGVLTAASYHPYEGHFEASKFLTPAGGPVTFRAVFVGSSAISTPFDALGGREPCSPSTPAFW